MIRFSADPYGVFASWLCERIEYVPSPNFRSLARVEHGRILGVVGYDSWNGASCQMHIGGSGRWLNRRLLFAAFDYPFNVCGLNCVLGLVPSGNQAALRFDRHLGFKEVAELKGAHPDGSLFLLRMDRSDCKWLKVRGGDARTKERFAA